MIKRFVLNCIVSVFYYGDKLNLSTIFGVIGFFIGIVLLYFILDSYPMMLRIAFGGGCGFSISFIIGLIVDFLRK